MRWKDMHHFELFHNGISKSIQQYCALFEANPKCNWDCGLYDVQVLKLGFFSAYFHLRQSAFLDPNVGSSMHIYVTVLNVYHGDNEVYLLIVRKPASISSMSQRAVAKVSLCVIHLLD